MAWVAKSRKLYENLRAEKEKAERMARMLADQDDTGAEDKEDDEERGGRQRSSRPEYTSRERPLRPPTRTTSFPHTLSTPLPVTSRKPIRTDPPCVFPPAASPSPPAHVILFPQLPFRPQTLALLPIANYLTPSPTQPLSSTSPLLSPLLRPAVRPSAALSLCASFRRPGGDEGAAREEDKLENVEAAEQSRFAEVEGEKKPMLP
ncbi:unnamed protein product [Closterium sp. NIES-64]|nr:unnamed protein product [Closterium sp. NIES-64]